jgi:small GTP-binding protein
MIGFPSVGKSSILNYMTETESEAAAYEFTTLTCIPGVLMINDAKLQLLDLPGIIEGASQGRGKGRQVIAVGKSSDLIMMVLDAQKGKEHKEKLTRELENVGIRLNKERPNISVKIMKTGGVLFNSSAKLTKIDEKMVKHIFQEYKIHNAHCNFRGDYDVDDLIDTIEGNRKYVKCIYVYNKIDTISIEEVDDLSKDLNNAVISARDKMGFDILNEKIWDALGLVRAYTKRRGARADFDEPLILTKDRNGTTIKGAILQIHKVRLNSFNDLFRTF